MNVILLLGRGPTVSALRSAVHTTEMTVAFSFGNVAFGNVAVVVIVSMVCSKYQQLTNICYCHCCDQQYH